ncbi:MAG: hypothetical protein IJ573_00675 [Clostridia bacterium]|nr:hypothetical protein [Clostridia bacterium]
MARMEIAGWDGLLNSMESRAQGVDERVARALQLSADALREALIEQEERRFKAPSGELGSLIPERPETVRTGSETYVEVYPTGSYMGTKAVTPRRAEEVGFVLEYGHGQVPPNPWNKRARKKAEKQINTIIEQELRIQ